MDFNSSTYNSNDYEESEWFMTKDIEFSEELLQNDIVSATFTPKLSTYDSYLFLMGTSDGGIIFWNPMQAEPITYG